MYKLIGHGLTRGEKIVPESQPMTLQERDSQSTIVLDPETMPEIGFDDWILDDGWPEGDHVWRVRNFGDSPLEDNVSIELEHVIKTLDDRQIVDDITTQMISGGSTCTARQAVEYLLAMQSDWTLGDFDYESVSNPYEFTGGSILDGIEAVTATLENSQWEYDMSVYPFVLHIRQRDTEAACEMRCGRNLATLRRTISRGGMFTRIYPTGQNNLHLTEGYLSKNENLYGRIEKEETDQNKTNEGSLRAWAQGMLNRHCEPEMNISVSGLELSEETGEALDRLRMNRVCRVPLPKKNIMILERIVRLQWRDRLREPENISVTLANNNADITEIVKSNKRSSGRAAKGQAKQNYLFQANGENLLYEVFDECGHVHGALRMTEESLRIGFENLNESTRSEFRLTSESLRIQFENEISSTRSEFRMTSESLRIQFENDLDSARSEFSMTAESLRISFESGLTSARGDFSITAESLRIAFANETTSLRTAINTEAGRISLVVEGSGSGATVKRASIVAAINEDSSSTVTIKADKVDLGAYVLASTLDTNWIKTQIENAGLISVGTLQIANGTTPTGSSNMVNILSLTRKYRVVEVTDGNNNVTGYKLQYTNLLNGATWVDCESGDQSVNFSRATSLGGSWSGNIYTITASPQGNSKSIGFSGDPGTNHVRLTVVQTSDTPTSSNTNDKYIDVPVKVTQSNPNAASTDRFTTTLQNVNATAAWNKGFAAGVPTAATLGSKVTGTTWNVSIARGSYTAVGKTIDLASAYTDARTGYYTKAQYDANWTTGFNAGVPTAATLGSKVTGTTWNVSIARGSYAAVGKTIDLANAYTDARSGYYTKAQYDAALATVPAGYFNSAVVAFAPTAHDGAGLNDGELVNPGTLRATAKNGTTQLGYNDTELHIGNSNWSSGKMTVAIRLAASNGKVISRKEFSMPSTASWSWTSPTSSTWKVTCTVNGKAYTSTHSKT